MGKSKNVTFKLPQELLDKYKNYAERKNRHTNTTAMGLPQALSVHDDAWGRPLYIHWFSF